jgi:hypothetical protein
VTNGLVIMNRELERTLKEAVVIYDIILNFPEGTEKKKPHMISQLR